MNYYWECTTCEAGATGVSDKDAVNGASDHAATSGHHFVVYGRVPETTDIQEEK
jgi:hypothetical protein